MLINLYPKKNKNASSIEYAYRIKYVDSVEKVELDDELMTLNIKYAKEKEALSQKEISAVDTDLKEAFKKKIAEHPKSKYFLFDIDNDNIPELYIVNVDEKGNIIDKSYTTTFKKKNGEVYDKAIAYERYGYYYSKSEDITPKLDSIEIPCYDFSFVGGFYVWNCNGTDRLIEKMVSTDTDKESYILEVINKYYNSPLIHVNNNNEKTSYQYIGENDLKKYLNGEKLEYEIQYIDKDYENKDKDKEKEYKKKILDYAKSIENNPVKTYSTTDLTGIENWDFSNIKVIKSNTTPKNDNNMASNDISVILNDKKLEFSQSPVIENGTTLVPMRAIFEAMGAEVNWDGETKTVTSSKDNTSIKLTVDSNSAEVNGSNVSLAVPAKIVNGSTMVPLRFVSESLGAEVSWDGETKTVSIKG